MAEGKMGMGVARPTKTRVVRFGFAKMNSWVLVFANPRVG